MATKRKKGRLWEYVVKRSRILNKPVYLTFDDEAEGDAYVAKLEAMLDRGIVPPELLQRGGKYALLGELIRDYLSKVAINDSDRRLLNISFARIGTARLSAINYAWVEHWIQQMKVELNLKPGTIRHHVGALGRCFDWAGRHHVVPLVINPIRQLPKSYAQYTERDLELARAVCPEHGRREDEERDRRLDALEEQAIRAVLDRQKRDDKERPFQLKYQAALELLFDLALETAMRLREMYTLTLEQVDLQRCTVFLDRTKNGSKRQVPLSSVIRQRIEEYMKHVEAGTRGMAGFTFDEGRLFPWWDGSFDKATLSALTSNLSNQFGRIFIAAGCRDFRFHDLRHEATSRFFERTTLQDFEIMKITGHSSTRMLRRYSNLRGSDLARKLW